MAAPKRNIGRRKLITGALALGAAASSTAVAAETRTPHRAPKPGADVTAFFGPIRPGARFGECRVAELYPVHLGAIAVVLEHQGSSFQVDVLKRDDAGPTPVGATPSLALFIANRGHGERRTDEARGLAVMALADALAERETHAKAPAGLLSLRERDAKHPGGAFSVG
jgi:hypothetical protein